MNNKRNNLIKFVICYGTLPLVFLLPWLVLYVQMVWMQGYGFLLDLAMTFVQIGLLSIALYCNVVLLKDTRYYEAVLYRIGLFFLLAVYVFLHCLFWVLPLLGTLAQCLVIFYESWPR